MGDHNRIRRFAAADPTGQEYMEFKGIPRRMDHTAVSLSWSPEWTNGKPAKIGTASAMIGDKEIASIYYEIHNHKAVIANVWCDPEARGWGIGKMLFHAFRDRMNSTKGLDHVRGIEAEIHTQEALRSMLLTYGPPAYMGDDYQKYSATPAGVQNARKKLWEAERAYPEQNGLIGGPGINTTWNLPDEEYDDDNGEYRRGPFGQWPNVAAIEKSLTPPRSRRKSEVTHLSERLAALSRQADESGDYFKADTIYEMMEWLSVTRN